MDHRTGLLAATLAAIVGLASAPAGSTSWTPSSGGGWVSGPVEHVRTVPFEAGTASDAVLHDDHLYVTTWRSFSIYDVSDPVAPVRRSTVHTPGSLYNERPQTDGGILLLSHDAHFAPRNDVHDVEEAQAALLIYDVTDPSSPTHLATWQNEPAGFMDWGTKRDHIWTCVLDCRYAYSAGGTILDLADPSAPRQVGDWTEVAPFEDGRMHDIAEVAPGILMTGSLPMHVLDARDDPATPALLASIRPETTTPAFGSEPLTVPNVIANPETLPARVDWPDALHGRLAVASMETPFTGPCSERSGDVQTFLTTGWRSNGTFQPADRYQLGTNGTYTDGAPPYNALGCSAYGMQVHPDFAQNGGQVAVAFFEHGVRVLEVDVHGTISELGGFLPAAGNSTAPIWRTDEILYVIDLHRGIDILRVTAP